MSHRARSGPASADAPSPAVSASTSVVRSAASLSLSSRRAAAPSTPSASAGSGGAGGSPPPAPAPPSRARRQARQGEGGELLRRAAVAGRSVAPPRAIGPRAGRLRELSAEQVLESAGRVRVALHVEEHVARGGRGQEGEPAAGHGRQQLVAGFA